MSLYIGNSNGFAGEVKKGYIGVNGVAQKFWDEDEAYNNGYNAGVASITPAPTNYIISATVVDECLLKVSYATLPSGYYYVIPISTDQWPGYHTVIVISNCNGTICCNRTGNDFIMGICSTTTSSCAALTIDTNSLTSSYFEAECYGNIKGTVRAYRYVLSTGELG